MHQTSFRTLVHPVLAVGYVANLTGGDEELTAIMKAFAKSLTAPKHLAIYVQRHPAFADWISRWADRADTNEARHTAVGILQAAQPAVLMEKMHDWLSSDVEHRVEFALKKIWEPEFIDYRKTWAREIAATISRHAAKQRRFEAKGLKCLDDLREDAEPAIDELVRFVRLQVQFLGDSAGTSGNRVYLDNGTQIELQSIVLPLKVLSRFPEKSKVLKSDVEKTLRVVSEIQEFNANGYNFALTEFLKALAAAKPGSKE